MNEPTSELPEHGGPVPPDTPTPTRSTGQKILAVCIILLLLFGGWNLAEYLVNSKPTAQRKPPAKMKTLVRVMQLQSSDAAIEIEAMGTVIPAHELDLKPRVAGTVVHTHPNLLPGGMLKQGEIVITLDDLDFKLDLERSKSNLEKAAMDLLLEEGNQAVARREYDLIKEFSGSSIKDAPEDLALRKPQLIKAKAAKAAAQSDFKQAKTNLERTRLQVPFNAIVRNKNVAIGSQVSSQTTVATLAGTDAFWVRIGISQEQLARIKLPVDDKSGAQVSLESATTDTEGGPRTGNIIRLLSDVDPDGLMARLLVEVKNPLQQNPGQPPLLLGSPVKARIMGNNIPSCFQIPGNTIRADKTVLLAGPDDKLIIRPVTVAWQDRDRVYITEGLKNGERLIISPVAAPVAGMELTISVGRSGNKKGKRERE